MFLILQMHLLFVITLLSSSVSASTLKSIPTDQDAVKRQAVDVTVDLGYEVYLGGFNKMTGLNTFKGIRYAAPPTGANRWQPPKSPASNRKAPISALGFASRCPQSSLSPYLFDACPNLQTATTLPARCANAPAFQTQILGNEDCLFLNVYAPPSVEKLPVLIYIPIINTNNNKFIGVTIQYRLGAFGFLSSDEVHRLGTPNAGILDQQFALQWAQDHISKFGGDPRKVTIAGESAGGGSVMLQAMAYGGTLGTKLFQNSIVASPYLPMQYGYADDMPTQNYNKFASMVGCSAGVHQSTFECLVSKDTLILQQASAIVSATTRYGTWAFLPVTDGNFVQDLPMRQLLQKKVNGQNILSGANEGVGFTPQNIKTEADFIAFLRTTFSLFTEADIARVLEVYPSTPAPVNPADALYATNGRTGPTALNQSSFGTGQQQRANNVYAETTFVCPSYWLADAFANSTISHSAYKYQYSVPPAQHAYDVGVYFGPQRPKYASPDFAAAFMRIWGNFITTSNPSISALTANGLSTMITTPPPTPGATAWPPYQSPDYSMLNLNQTGGVPSIFTFNATGAINPTTHIQDPNVIIPVRYSIYDPTAMGAEQMRNDFAVVDAAAWEGRRGVRCQFWRGVGGVVPE